ncbi:MAG: effector binding domain-containing protein [Defluviitaleaceae bacterium]|nr:effector binding domain-containing protein [Defluviitaleaceae bacterium]
MDLVTISQVSKMFDVSTRMLRYYEQIGLLKSKSKDDYAYRVYDDVAIGRLQQIIVLRKLRIPLKQIALIFEDASTKTAIDVFMQNIKEINDEITALSTMRAILNNLADGLRHTLGAKTDTTIKSMLMSDEALLAAINSLSLTKINFKEMRSMDELNKASETLARLNVRIVQLPPAAVASYHFIGENPEETTGEVINKFAKDVNLYEIKPDARMYGFNHPNPPEDGKPYGYEVWVTVPDDLDVPAPLVKKQFAGGLYAAHTIKFPNFHEWDDLNKWVENSDKFDKNLAAEGAEVMHGLLEEHLNWVYANHLGWKENFIDGQLDLLLPIKLKNN